MEITTKYYLYIRKSTDEVDRQVLSLEAQMHELKEFAVREHIEIVGTYIEKKTAKVPGREVFNSVLDTIEHGLPHQIGILSWNPDRLSRNSVDAGRIIYLLDTNKLHDLRFPTFAFQNSPSGKFFLSIALSNAKYYVDNLSENVQRGNRAKLRRGEWPGQKPYGYVYDHRLRNIVPEPKEAKIVKQIYQEFASGKHTLKSISARLAEISGEKLKSNFAVEYLLTNDLYIGVMKWNKETYEGKYKPIVSQQLFARVQEAFNNRRRPRKSKVRHDFPLTGLFRCSCSSMISAQFTKGNGGLYRYYRCTRKHGECTESYVQEKELQRQIVERAQTIALPTQWTTEMLAHLKSEEEKESKSVDVLTQDVNQKITLAQQKLDKLLEGYLDNLIDEESYKRKKENLVGEKNSLKHEKESLQKTRMSNWIEPTRDFINTLIQAKNLDSSESLQEIPQFLLKIGTNHLISAKTAIWDFREPYGFTAGFMDSIPNPAGGSAGGFSDSGGDFSVRPLWCAGKDSNLRRPMASRFTVCPR